MTFSKNILKSSLFLFLSSQSFGFGAYLPSPGPGGGGGSGGSTPPSSGSSSSSSRSSSSSSSSSSRSSSSSSSSSSSRSSSSVASSSSSSTQTSFDAATDISAIAQKSSCRTYNWKNRGTAPSAYIKGMAVVFAKSLCRMRDGQSGATLMSYRNAPVPNGDSATRSDKIGNAKYDAIAHYAGIFDAQKMNIDSSGAESLKSLYTLGIGLGMRESSGEHCTGYDTSAGPETAEEAEAGLFQTSYNAIGTSTELRKIYADYNAGNSNCRLDIFSKNVSCANQPIIGTGAGADFQRKLKSCPALAAEFAMITLRVVRTHYGPINRQEAEVRPECHDMLDDVQSYVEHDPINVCQQL